MLLLLLMAGFFLHRVCFTELFPRFRQSAFPGKPETLLSVILSSSVKSGCLVADRKHGGIQCGAWETRSNQLKGWKSMKSPTPLTHALGSLHGISSPALDATGTRRVPRS